jgi:hypothetical protein
MCRYEIRPLSGDERDEVNQISQSIAYPRRQRFPGALNPCVDENFSSLTAKLSIILISRLYARSDAATVAVHLPGSLGLAHSYCRSTQDNIVNLHCHDPTLSCSRLHAAPRSQR